MMLRVAVAAAVAFASLVPSGVRAADTYEIDPAHTSVQFSIRHMMISNVRGEFTKLSGKATGDVANPTAASVEATIEASSIDTRNEKRDEHLRSPDFLDTGKFPTITFKSTKVEKAGDGWKLTGNLTLHGVTKEISFPATVQAGEGGLSLTSQFDIDRTQFGMTFGEGKIENKVSLRVIVGEKTVAK